jgi:mannose-6-phosphate isomerase-like protein (cupin superfamily)
MASSTTSDAFRERVGVRPSAEDVRVLLRAVKAGASLQAENLNGDLYLEKVIEKPWGYEYRVYSDVLYDVWALSLRPGQRTSLHCHPRKETALLCLSGTGQIGFLDSSVNIKEGDLTHIPRAVFHGTTNSSTRDVLELVEVETPRNKLDLVRQADEYGRKGAAYETTTMEMRIKRLEAFRYTPDGKVRPESPDDRYRFAVRAGMDIVCRHDRNILAVVSLAAINACVGTIEVTLGSAGDIDHDNFYLTISRA